MGEDRDWPAVFDAAFRNLAETNTTVRRVWRSVYAEEYPDGVDPYSPVSRSELHLLRDQLRIGPGDIPGDIGCWRGGPGLWLAATTGADLIGVDISQVALDALPREVIAVAVRWYLRYGMSYRDVEELLGARHRGRSCDDLPVGSVVHA